MDLVRYRREAPSDLGPMLRAARGRISGLTVTEAARRTHISRPQLSNIEAGRRVPSVVVARALADVLALDDAERAQLMAVAVNDAGRSHPERAVS